MMSDEALDLGRRAPVARLELSGPALLSLPNAPTTRERHVQCPSGLLSRLSNRVTARDGHLVWPGAGRQVGRAGFRRAGHETRQSFRKSRIADGDHEASPEGRSLTVPGPAEPQAAPPPEKNRRLP